MKKLLLILGSLTILLANPPMLKETAYKYVKASIGKGKPHFVEVGSDSCHACQVMGRTLYGITQKYPNLNIEFVNVRKERKAAFDLKVRMIPTQLIFDATGKEVYRHIGTLTPAKLEALFKQYHF